MLHRIYSLGISYYWPILWACFSSETKRYNVPCTDCCSAPLRCMMRVVWGGGQAGQGFTANQRFLKESKIKSLHFCMMCFHFFSKFPEVFCFFFFFSPLGGKKKKFFLRRGKKRDYLLKIQGFLSKDLRSFYHSSQPVWSFTGFKTLHLDKCFFVKINIVRWGYLLVKKKKNPEVL